MQDEDEDEDKYEDELGNILQCGYKDSPVLGPPAETAAHALYGVSVQRGLLDCGRA